LIKVAKNLEIDPKVLMAIDSKNDDVRNNRDWEKMKGRAIL